MPFLIRIVLQRTLLSIGVVLTFFGVSPEVEIPTTQEALIQIEERKEIITNVLKNPSDDLETEESPVVVEEETETQFKIPEDTQENPANVIPQITTPSFTTESPEPQIDIPQEITDLQEILEEETKTIEPSTTKKTYNNLGEVIVNIICTHQGKNITTASVGSGVLVSSKGVVLTNAHVAQFFLLEDYMNCALYQQNIPNFGYKADLLHISGDWIRENYRLINNPNPTGTGENDYALLLITKNTNASFSLPSKFPYANISTDKDAYLKGKEIDIAGFPGAPSSIIDLAQSGTLQTDTSTITEIFTFNRNTIDVLTTGITKVAAKGASGGGIFSNNELIGMTVTTTGSPGKTKINALTTVYINKDLIEETGVDFGSMFAGNLSNRVSNFKSHIAPDLADLLESQL